MNPLQEASFPLFPSWFNSKADEKTMSYCKQLWSAWDFRDQVHWWESRLQMGKTLTWDDCDWKPQSGVFRTSLVRGAELHHVAAPPGFRNRCSD